MIFTCLLLQVLKLPSGGQTGQAENWTQCSALNKIGRMFRILSIFSNGTAGIRRGLPGSESAQNRESKAGLHNHGQSFAVACSL